MAISQHERVRHGTDEWLTPPWMLLRLGEFDLDPCAPIERPWPMAARHYTLLEDGLAQNWQGRVWLNPPYGPQTGRWLGRLANHGNGIALVFARTETTAFRNSVWPCATALLFVYGRVTFHHVDGTQAKAASGGPSVLIAYGEDNAHALLDSGIPGAFVRPVR